MNVYDILLAKKFAGGGGVTPTGNINITDTAVTDVAAYATAQVVDGNLVADNIKKDIDILGVTHTYTETDIPVEQEPISADEALRIIVGGGANDAE